MNGTWKRTDSGLGELAAAAAAVAAVVVVCEFIASMMWEILTALAVVALVATGGTIVLVRRIRRGGGLTLITVHQLPELEDRQPRQVAGPSQVHYHNHYYGAVPARRELEEG